MAHFMRGKQAGVQNDFSANVTSELFAIDDVGLPTYRSAIDAVSQCLSTL